MAILSKAEILSAEDLPRRVVEVPEWGGAVILQGMTALEYVQFAETLEVEDPKFWIKILPWSLVDESGEKLFSLDDIEALGGKNPEVILRLGRIANGLNKAGEKSIQEQLENLAEAQSDGSLSG